MLVVVCGSLQGVMMSEAKLKSWVRSNYNGWSEAFEPRRGAGVGVADIMLAHGSHLVPVELKIGTISDGQLYPEEVRPDQIGWHHRLNAAGVFSFFLVGVGKASGKAPEYLFAITAQKIKHWRTGFDLDDLKMIRTKTALFNQDIAAYMKWGMSLEWHKIAV